MYALNFILVIAIFAIGKAFRSISIPFVNKALISRRYSSEERSEISKDSDGFSQEDWNVIQKLTSNGKEKDFFDKSFEEIDWGEVNGALKGVDVSKVRRDLPAYVLMYEFTDPNVANGDPETMDDNFPFEEHDELVKKYDRIISSYIINLGDHSGCVTTFMGKDNTPEEEEIVKFQIEDFQVYDPFVSQQYVGSSEVLDLREICQNEDPNMKSDFRGFLGSDLENLSDYDFSEMERVASPAYMMELEQRAKEQIAENEDNDEESDNEDSDGFEVDETFSEDEEYGKEEDFKLEEDTDTVEVETAEGSEED